VEDILNLRYALDTFYFLVSGALVMWMAAGFAMLEAGLVRSKNTAEILTKNVALFAIACVMYMLMGYNIMYPGDGNGYVPAFDFSFMFGGDNDPAEVLATNPDEWYDGSYYSGMSDFFFQVVFVATAMSIVSGAVAERMKLWAFLAFAVVMTGFIYPMQGYWKWGGGFLDELGFNDFAGSGVVHLCGAAAALAGVLLLGARKGKYGPNGEIYPIPGANLPLATLGTFILWLGWFGFNGGSQLAMDSAENASAIARIFVNTNLAAAAGAVTALILTQIIYRKVDITMVLNGALAGLVSITAEPLTPSIPWALFIGAVGGLIVVIVVPLLDKLKIDDVVGAIPVHLVAGIWGTIAVAFTNSDASFGTQIIGIAAIGAFTFIVSLVIWSLLKFTIGIRVSEEEEMMGLDAAEIGVEAYPEFGKGSQAI